MDGGRLVLAVVRMKQGGFKRLSGTEPGAWGLLSLKIAIEECHCWPLWAMGKRLCCLLLALSASPGTSVGSPARKVHQSHRGFIPAKVLNEPGLAASFRCQTMDPHGSKLSVE